MIHRSAPRHERQRMTHRGPRRTGEGLSEEGIRSQVRHTCLSAVAAAPGVPSSKATASKPLLGHADSRRPQMEGLRIRLQHRQHVQQERAWFRHPQPQNAPQGSMSISASSAVTSPVGSAPGSTCQRTLRFPSEQRPTWWSPDPNAVCARGLVVHSGLHSGGHGCPQPRGRHRVAPHPDVTPDPGATSAVGVPDDAPARANAPAAKRRMRARSSSGAGTAAHSGVSDGVCTVTPSRGAAASLRSPVTSTAPSWRAKTT